jgi:ligand-binding SRPBCC domain-containing protein
MEFVDYQLRGPFALWVHHHDFREEDGATVMTDRVDMVIPTLARPFWPLIRWQLLGIFRYRARRIEEWIRREGEKKKG